MKSDSLIIDFGSYCGMSADALFFENPKYCKWITQTKSFLKNHAQLVDFFNQKFEENPNVLNSDIMPYGKYIGCKVEDFIDDQEYCKYLLKSGKAASWFKSQCPKMYEDLEKMYSVYYGESFVYLYVLVFNDSDFIKIGHTKQFTVKRMYNYVYGDVNYSNYNVNWKKSFVYKTNRLSAEKDLFNLIESYRLFKKQEKFHLNALNEVDFHIKNLNSKGAYYFNKKSLFDLIPFKDGAELKEKFYIKINDFKNFDENYFALLLSEGLYQKYNPGFIAHSN